MANDGFMYVEESQQTYKRVVHLDGVRTTVCENRFEITVQPHCEIWEQLAVQQLREWIRWRKAQEELQNTRSVPR